MTIATSNVPYYVEKLRAKLPDARLLFVSPAEGVTPHVEADAFAIPAERGSALALRFPQYAVVVPGPDLIKVPLAFAMPRGESDLARFVDTWIDLKRDDGTLEALQQQWILGRNPSALGPRWSIIRDVLHWAD